MVWRLRQAHVSEPGSVCNSSHAHCWSRPSRCATAAASPRPATPSLARMWETCRLAVFSVMNRVSPVWSPPSSPRAGSRGSTSWRRSPPSDRRHGREPVGVRCDAPTGMLDGPGTVGSACGSGQKPWSSSSFSSASSFDQVSGSGTAARVMVTRSASAQTSNVAWAGLTFGDRSPMVAVSSPSATRSGAQGAAREGQPGRSGPAATTRAPTGQLLASDIYSSWAGGADAAKGRTTPLPRCPTRG
jgi:hypothetical protein